MSKVKQYYTDLTEKNVDDIMKNMLSMRFLSMTQNLKL